MKLDMEHRAAVPFSGPVGRKPAKNPKAIQLGLRVDLATADLLDEEVERLRKKNPGWAPTRTDAVRALLAEAFAARKRRGK